MPPRLDNEIRVSQSVLDRLIDYDPRQSQEAPKSRLVSLRELRQAVRRDLEWLLNTRCHTESLDEGLEEAKKSVAFFGLPELLGFSPKSHVDQKLLVKALETAIKIFEPRFIDLKVSHEPFDNVDRQMKFKIEARLDVEPTPEPIVFDTVIEVGSGEFAITER
jgi:type VI secretion system protein ImpF